MTASPPLPPGFGNVKATGSNNGVVRVRRCGEEEEDEGEQLSDLRGRESETV